MWLFDTTLTPVSSGELLLVSIPVYIVGIWLKIFGDGGSENALCERRSWKNSDGLETLDFFPRADEIFLP